MAIGDELTTREKVDILFRDTQFNKRSLCIKIGISRPTLYTRLREDNWKLMEVMAINDLYKRMILRKPENRESFGETKYKKYNYKDKVEKSEMMDDIWRKLSGSK